MLKKNLLCNQGLTTNDRQGRVLAITRKNHPVFEKMLTFNADEYEYSLELKYLVWKTTVSKAGGKPEHSTTTSKPCCSWSTPSSALAISLGSRILNPVSINTGCSLKIMFFLKILWFFWTLPVLLHRWFSTCLVCVHTLTPRENRERPESKIILKIWKKHNI